MLSEIRELLEPLGFEDNLTTTLSIEDLQRFAMSNFGSFPLLRYDIVPNVVGEVTQNVLMVNMFVSRFV